MALFGMVDESQNKDRESLFSVIKQCFNKEERLKNKSAQETIRYKKMYPNGICQIDDIHFNKTIRFFDINYQLAHTEDKHSIFNEYCKFLNHFDPSVNVQMTFVNEYANIDDEKKLIDIDLQADNLNDVRIEYRDYLREQLSKGNNGLIRHKYITFTIEAKNIHLAKSKLARLELDVINDFKSIGVSSYALNGKERLELLYDILNDSIKTKFNHSFDWNEVEKNKIDTRDFISPIFFDFRKNKNVMQFGNKYASFQHLIIDAPQLEDRFLAEFLDMNAEMIVTINFNTMLQHKAVKYVKDKISAMEGVKSEYQKKAVASGYDMDTLPPDLKTNLVAGNNLLIDLQGNNERYFLTSIYITNISRDQNKLQNDIFQAQSIAQKGNCTLKQYDYVGEDGINCMLPLGINNLYPKRGLTTSSQAVFIPFTTQELFQGGQAMYYGLNALSNNMIMADRKQLKNPNGLILGVPGSGKSFSAKREMANVLLTTKDDVIVCDPEGEYGMREDENGKMHNGFVQAFGGQEIFLSTSSDTYINPLDISENYGLEDDPIFAKADQILSIMELIVGERNGLTPIQKSIIDRCVRQIYMKWDDDKKPENIPILEDLYNSLKEQNNPEADYLADGLEIYVDGSLQYFNHRTNVIIDNRFVSFNIKELGKSLKKFAMLVVEDHIWNIVSQNRASNGKFTWVYFDEFHRLLSDPQTASFSVEIWQRFRKWGAIPTGITQNVKKFMESKEIENIFDNTSFYYLLSQASGDKEILANSLKISKSQLSFVENANPGSGLIVYDNVILPFVDNFPRDTKLYRLMDTNHNRTKE